jgi:hypothetical protein
MKQRITAEQLNELSQKGKDKLRDWWRPEEGDWYCHTKKTKQYTILNSNDSDWGMDYYQGDKPRKKDLPLLSIGQMIEFLDDNNEKSIFFDWEKYLDVSVYPDGEIAFEITPKGFCDALWEAVKEVLES